MTDRRRLTLLRTTANSQDCPNGVTCPAVYYDHDTDRFAVQGPWVSDPEVLAALNLPDGETAVWLPGHLLPELVKGDPRC